MTRAQELLQRLQEAKEKEKAGTIISPAKLSKEPLKKFKEVVKKFNYKGKLTVRYDGVQSSPFDDEDEPDLDQYTIIQNGKKGTTFYVDRVP